jgi:hypothetical protein
MPDIIDPPRATGSLLERLTEWCTANPALKACCLDQTQKLPNVLLVANEEKDVDSLRESFVATRFNDYGCGSLSFSIVSADKFDERSLPRDMKPIFGAEAAKAR